MEQNETKEERIAKLEVFVRDTTAELRKLKGENPDTTDVLARHNNRSDLAALFDKMTLAERTELSRANPEKWAEMLEAKNRSGLADLYASN